MADKRQTEDVVGGETRTKRSRTDNNTSSDHSTVLLGSKFVCAMGLGTLPLGVLYPNPSLVPKADNFNGLLSAAVNSATTNCNASLFIDTADTYCPDGSTLHSCECDIASWATANPALSSSATIASKGGMNRTSSQESTSWRGGNTSPAGVTAAIDASYKALGCSDTNPLYLWQMHHVDGSSLSAPGGIEKSLAAAHVQVQAGKVQYLGICNATESMLRRAVASLPAGVLCSIQNEYSFWCREAEQVKPEGAAASSKKGVISVAAELNVTFIAYAPLGGLKARRGERSLKKDFPVTVSVAQKRSEQGGVVVSPEAVYLAYLRVRGLRLGVRMLLIPGARTAEHAADSVSAAALVLSDEEVSVLDAAWAGGKTVAGKKKAK